MPSLSKTKQIRGNADENDEQTHLRLMNAIIAVRKYVYNPIEEMTTEENVKLGWIKNVVVRATMTTIGPTP